MPYTVGQTPALLGSISTGVWAHFPEQWLVIKPTAFWTPT